MMWLVRLKVPLRDPCGSLKCRGRAYLVKEYATYDAMYLMQDGRVEAGAVVWPGMVDGELCKRQPTL